ncbi:MAG: hypothetical protein LC623_08890 [Halobacteriales archaeon]|nr:hypothetical protein [Halobacteriales archaeon]
MLACFSFAAKPGFEGDFERLLDNEAGGRAVALAMGATRNTLFLGHGRMVRVFEFPDGARPTSLAELARTDPKVADFLRRLAPLIEGGFDLDEPGSIEAFNQRNQLALAYDVYT